MMLIHKEFERMVFKRQPNSRDFTTIFTADSL